jgi:hypothetical protein
MKRVNLLPPPPHNPPTLQPPKIWGRNLKSNGLPLTPSFFKYPSRVREQMKKKAQLLGVVLGEELGFLPSQVPMNSPTLVHFLPFSIQASS